jgi:hypothetical protein
VRFYREQFEDRAVSEGNKVYRVSSVYKVEGESYIEAPNAAEAARIGTQGYPDGSIPQFYFSEPYGETKMRATLARGEKPTEVAPARGSADT